MDQDQSQSRLGRPWLDYRSANSHRAINWRWWRRVILVVIVVLLLAASMPITIFARWYHGFNKRLELARMHAPIVQKLLEADSRFTGVHVGEFTDADGCLLVQAYVKPGSEDDLKKLVMSTSPPVYVMYKVEEWKQPTSAPAR